MRHLFLAALVSTLLLGVGIYHGLATDRWVDPDSGVSPGQCFADLPANIGDWKSETLPRQADDDSKTSMLIRKYTHTLSGRWVLTSISSGRAGRVSIHNPEHCYLGSGYKVIDSIREESIDLGGGSVAKLWTGHFEKKKPSGVESIRIYWGWTYDGRWQAPSYPRLFYAGQPRLHKLYVIHPVPTGDAGEDAAPYREFMAQYVAELNRHLSP